MDRGPLESNLWEKNSWILYRLIKFNNLIFFLCLFVFIDSVIGIATCYGLDGPWIKSGWGRVWEKP
jgi:hypothetical protein